MDEQAQEAQPLPEEKQKQFATLAAFVGDRSLAIRILGSEIEEALKQMNDIRCDQSRGAPNSSGN